MDRTPNFLNDNEIGKIGENIFEKHFYEYITLNESKGKTLKLVDVRDDKVFQELDIDYVALIDNHAIDDLLINIRSGNPKLIDERVNNIGYTFEVKTDTRTSETGNIVYEILSHNMPGCLARCYADFLIYVCLNRYNHNIVDAVYSINVHKLRNWLTNNNNKKYYKTNAISKEGILNFLINIDSLIDCGVAKKIKTAFIITD